MSLHFCVQAARQTSLLTPSVDPIPLQSFIHALTFVMVFTVIGLTEALGDFISKTRIEVSILTICLRLAVLLHC